MNTYTKFIPRLFAVVLFLSIVHPVIGQDYIRGSDSHAYGVFSIIRETAKDTVLIYYRKPESSTFMLVANGNVNVQTIKINPIFVNDFEVYNNVVFYCGYVLEGNEKKAILGHFNLKLFPNSSITYYKIYDCQELKKLDVYHTVEFQDYGEIRMVSIGTSSGVRSDVLVDLTTNTLFPMNCDMHFSYSENENFDDVAVTDKYVVVSSRNKEQENLVVDFWYYKKPHYVGQDIFNSNANRFRIYSPMIDSPVILEHTRKDSVAAVYKVAGFNRMAMLSLNVPDDTYRIFEIMGDTTETVFPIDIKYNTRNSVYAILAHKEGRMDITFIPPMQIYFVTQNDLAGLTINGQGTNYIDEYFHIWSLAPLRKTSDDFVASGSAIDFPRLFHFNNVKWGPCSNNFEYQYYRGNLKGHYTEITISPYSYNIERFWSSTVPNMILFPPKCPKL